MFSLFLAATLSAHAGTVELVPVEAGHPSISVTVNAGANGPTTDAFIEASLDVDHYPLTASYMGVRAITASQRLATLSDGTVVLHQVTGGNLVVSPRQYVTALKETVHTETVAEVQWFLVKHTVNADGSFSGPYAATLNAHRDDAVYTPYSHGTWRYDRSAGTIKYSTESDPGGALPDFLVSKDAVSACPKELLMVMWGILAK